MLLHGLLNMMCTQAAAGQRKRLEMCCLKINGYCREGEEEQILKRSRHLFNLASVQQQSRYTHQRETKEERMCEWQC